MTKWLRNDGGTSDAITAGCLFGCHETLQGQIVRRSSTGCTNPFSNFVAFPNLTARCIEEVRVLQALQLTMAVLWSSSCSCLAATSELSLQMVSGCSQWLIWWLIGSPIKANGMSEPLGRNTECIINSTKSSLFCIATEAVIPRATRVRGAWPLTPNHPDYCARKGHSIVWWWHVDCEAHSWIAHSWLVSTLAHNGQTKMDF